MAYIEREKVCEICNNKGDDCGKEKCPVYKVPTADVVPRAEADRLQNILNYYAMQYGTVKDKREVMVRIKREIVRDIVMGAKDTLLDYHLQENKKYLKSQSKTKKRFEIETTRYRAITEAIELALNTLNEKEKKYTEDGK